MSADEQLNQGQFGGIPNQEGAAQPVIPASNLPRVRIGSPTRSATGADVGRYLDDLHKGVEVPEWHDQTYQVPVKRGYDDPRLADLQQQIHAKNERNARRELEDNDPNQKAPGWTTFQLKPDSDLDAMAKGIQRALDASDALEQERDLGKRVPEGNHPIGTGEQYMRNRWHMANDPTRNFTPQGRQRSRDWVRKRWENVTKQLTACEHRQCPPWAHVERTPKRGDREPGE